MDISRCAKCNKPLMAMTDRTGRPELRCLKCEKASPRKTVATTWAERPQETATKRSGANGG